MLNKQNTVLLDTPPTNWTDYKNMFVAVKSEQYVYYVNNTGGQNCVMYAHSDYSMTPASIKFDPYLFVEETLKLQEELESRKKDRPERPEKEPEQAFIPRVGGKMSDFVDTARLVELVKTGLNSDDLVKLRGAGIV